MYVVIMSNIQLLYILLLSYKAQTRKPRTFRQSRWSVHVKEKKVMYNGQ